jgi:hypothetical protein
MTLGSRSNMCDQVKLLFLFSLSFVRLFFGCAVCLIVATFYTLKERCVCAHLCVCVATLLPPALNGAIRSSSSFSVNHILVRTLCISDLNTIKINLPSSLGPRTKKRGRNMENKSAEICQGCQRFKTLFFQSWNKIRLIGCVALIKKKSDVSVF